MLSLPASSSSVMRRPGANVSRHKATGRWCAYGNFNGKRFHLGLFSTPDEAAAAVVRFKVERDIELDDRAPIAQRVEYSAGLLVWKQHGKQHRKGDAVGSIDRSSGYRFVRDAGKKLYVHRIVWELLAGPIGAGREIDHINGNRSDNRIENLRAVTRSENLKNQRSVRANRTGYRGVTRLEDGRFLARVWSNGKAIVLGRFDSAEQAFAARLSAAPHYGYHENHGKRLP